MPVDHVSDTTVVKSFNILTLIKLSKFINASQCHERRKASLYSRQPATQLGIRMEDSFWRIWEVKICFLVSLSRITFGSQLIFFLNRVSPWPETYQIGWAGKPLSPRDLSVSNSLEARITINYCQSWLIWLLKFELRFPTLQGEPLNDWVIVWAQMQTCC